MENRFLYSDLMSLHAILRDQSFYCGIHKIIESCVFSERKLKIAFKNLSEKEVQREQQLHTHSVTTPIGALIVHPAHRAEALKYVGGVDCVNKILFETEYEDLPLLINDTGLNNLQLLILRWRFELGK